MTPGRRGESPREPGRDAPGEGRRRLAGRLRGLLRGLSAERAERRLEALANDLRSARPRAEHLPRTTRERMLQSMPGWSFDPFSKAFEDPKRTTSETSEEAMDELLDAICAERGRGSLALRVRGLSAAQAARVRGYLGEGSELFVPGLEASS